MISFFYQFCFNKNNVRRDSIIYFDKKNDDK